MGTEVENSWNELISSFISFHPTYHIVFEMCLILSGLFLYFRRSYKPTEVVELTKKEEEELIAEWKCEPLVPNDWVPDPVIQSKFDRTINSSIGKTVTFSDDDRVLLNCASFNFFNLVGDEKIRDAAVKGLRKYGVGSCGPRGFYGTFDAHLHLEEQLADFLHCEESVVYSFGFSTVASAIPAYSKRGDIIFVDEEVHFAIQCGLVASRSKIEFFRHNDMEHLEELLQLQQVAEARDPARASVTRKFLVVEGLYLNRGDVCPLPRLVEFKYRYKVRIFIDETISFGVLGENGRGVTEHFGVDPDDIDLITGSLETALSGCGGFSVGSKYVVDHQRLSGQGYCFSASLPPLLACSASVALDIVKGQRGMDDRRRLVELSKKVTDGFNGSRLHKFWTLQGDSVSPVKHIRCRHANSNSKLEEITTKAANEGFLLTVARYLSDSEHKCPEPSIRLSLNCSLSDDEVDSFLVAMEKIGADL